MKELESGSFLNRPLRCAWPETVRVVSWNINRGLQLSAVVDFLEASSADLILLQETDVNAHRTGHRDIPRRIAQALRMDYIFGREFEELAQGSRSNPAYHGQTTLSRLPLSNGQLLRFREQSTFWRPRWFVPPVRCMQRRLGGRMALLGEIAAGGRTLLLCNVHLESRGSDELRMRQLSEILTGIGQHRAEMPVLVAGDFNFDVSRGPAASLIASTGFDNPFASFAGGGTVLESKYARPAAIDWMLTRGAVSACHPAIHKSIVASDHFPLSLELRIQ